MFLRRLDPENVDDQALLRIAFGWETENIPTWWENAQQIFGPDTWEESLQRSRRPEQIDIAVADDSNTYCGLITLVLVAPKTYEFFFSAPRKSNAELLALACFNVGKQILIDDGIAERLISWVCARHRGALRINRECGMERDGLSMFKGRSHGKALEWYRLTLTRDRLMRLIDNNVEEKNDATDKLESGAELFDGRHSESLRVYDSARHSGHSGGAGMEAAN